MNKTYAVVIFSSQSLFDALSNPNCESEQVARQKQATYLSDYLTDLKAETIVIEYDYIDGDYLEDFASYYVRCFQHYERRCRRLHFFNIKFDDSSFGKLITTKNYDDLKNFNESYLGFVVVRPLPSAIVGRTVLKTYPHNSHRRNYTAVKDYEANLFGIELDVRSLAFQEQDTVLSACATVALWSAFQMTHELFGSPSPRPAEITRLASNVAVPSRAIPSHGLEIRQMAHAIRSIGLEPEFIPAHASTPLVSIAYSYLKMQLPVILIVDIENRGKHGITLTGFSLCDSKIRSQEVASGEKSIPMIGLRINEFYAHDDQIGPFSRLIVKPSSQDLPVLFEGQWKDEQTEKILTLKPVSLLIPVYNKIRVTAIDVVKWLERLSELLLFFLPDKYDYEWDMYLTTNNDLKKSIKTESFPQVDLERILSNQQPRFIWRSIFRLDSQPIIELFADATDMERSFPMFEQVWHNKSFQNIFNSYLQNSKIKDVIMEILNKRFYEFLITTDEKQ